MTPDCISKKILKRLYHQEGLTQQQIADRLGCNKSTVSKYLREYGQVSKIRHL